MELLQMGNLCLRLDIDEYASIRLAETLGLLDSAEDCDTGIDEYASIRLAEALGLSIN